MARDDGRAGQPVQTAVAIAFFRAQPAADCWGKIGGGRRTRTFEAMRRLIYSQLPLPLGTLPRLTASKPTRRNGDRKAMDDAKTADPITGSRLARLWGNSPGKVNQRWVLINA